MIKKLPDSEFEIMKVIWSNTPPLTTKEIEEKLDNNKGWKPQTILSLLGRLVDRGFLSSEKKGKERLYYPIVLEENYLVYETEEFMEKFHKNSFLSLVNTLYKGRKLSDKDLEEFKEWIKEKE